MPRRREALRERFSRLTVGRRPDPNTMQGFGAIELCDDDSELFLAQFAR